VKLRTRLLIVLVGIVLVGLLVSGVVTYKSLQSFLFTRLDQQLENSPAQAARAAWNCEIQDSAPSPSGPGTCSLNDVPDVPPGTYVQLRVVGQNPFSLVFLQHVSKSGTPRLPANPALSTQQRPSIFTTTSLTGLTYNTLAAAVTGPWGEGVVVVAVPLTAVDQTLGRLLLIELLVSLAVLIVLGALAWWIVRAGLRPLDEMTDTAGAIAAGDLSQRVPQGDSGTEVGRLGEALNVMLGGIEESFAARKASEERLRRFLADASHELRTPLTSIRGYAEMFDRGVRDRPDDLETSMRHIRADADRMSTLVDDLLVLARLGRERPLAHELVDLREVVQEAAAAIAVQDPERTIRVVAPDPTIVVGDGGRLRQVVDNLLVNAVRHTPAGSPIEIDLGQQSGSAVISVLDRGPGIPPDERERIFEPFFRSDPSRSRATGGEGLGLAIVSTIVEAHGGQVGVSPRQGGGAQFWIRIPVAQAIDEPGGVDPAKDQLAAGKFRVHAASESGAVQDPGAVANGRGAVSASTEQPPTDPAVNGTVPVVAPSNRAGDSGSTSS
jgi:two-component system, OmpR family, sensor kinase